MKNKTTGFFIAGNILTVLIVVQVIIYGGLFRRIKDDAKMINEIGKIRGQIQRVVKLELAYEGNTGDRKIIDDLIDSYMNSPFSRDINHPDLVTDINNVKKSLEELAIRLDHYHQSPNKEEMGIVISQSEQAWEIANDAVFRAQEHAERKASYFRFFALGFSLNVIAILVILFIFKKSIYDELKVSAIHDPLTGAFNRRYFNEYIDLFKNVNDTYGHVVGDHVLQAVVRVVQETIRNHDVLARVGGEEFVVLLPDTKMENGLTLAERVRKEIERHEAEGIPPVTISLGIVELKNDDTSKTIIERVDMAVYQAKRNGRNRIEIG